MGSLILDSNIWGKTSGPNRPLLLGAWDQRAGKTLTLHRAQYDLDKSHPLAGRRVSIPWGRGMAEVAQRPGQGHACLGSGSAFHPQETLWTFLEPHPQTLRSCWLAPRGWQPKLELALHRRGEGGVSREWWWIPGLSLPPFLPCSGCVTCVSAFSLPLCSFFIWDEDKKAMGGLTEVPAMESLA